MAGDESKQREPTCPAGWELWQQPYPRDMDDMDGRPFIEYAREALRRKPEIDGQLMRLAEGADEAALLDEHGTTPLRSTFWTESKREVLVYGYPRPQAHIIIKRKDDGDNDRRAIEFLKSTKLPGKQQPRALDEEMGYHVPRAKFRVLRSQAGPLKVGHKAKE